MEGKGGGGDGDGSWWEEGEKGQKREGKDDCNREGEAKLKKLGKNLPWY